MAKAFKLEDTMMEFAIKVSELSKCTERHVGAVITDNKYSTVYSIGYNGGPAGLADCLCKTDGKYGCLHAEINALIKCSTTDKHKVMFVTLAPCKQCATAIINAGFDKVFYSEPWKEDTGLKLLQAAGIQTIRYYRW